MQRHFNSLKRHPTVLAEYVKKSIPPSLIPNLFKRSSIEPDALGEVITALRSSVETDPELGPSTCLAYLSALVRTFSSRCSVRKNCKGQGNSSTSHPNLRRSRR